MKKEKIETTTTKKESASKKNNKGKLYNRVPVKTKLEIKARYEVGENLVDLAIEYKINYGSLKNCASRECWEKGKISQLIYKKIEDELFKNNSQEIGQHYREHYELHQEYLEALKGYKISDISKAKSEALKNYMSIIDSSYEFGKKILGINNTKEQIEEEILNIKLEQMKKDIEKDKEDESVEIE